MNFSVKMPECNLCDYTCGDDFNMQRHLKSVHGNQKFPCNQCDSVFNRRDHLKEHIQLKHGTLGPKLSNVFNVTTKQQISLIWLDMLKQPMKLKSSLVITVIKNLVEKIN